MTAAALADEAAARLVRAGLEGDGVGHQLFELLWKRDSFSDSALALRIPDTVIFKYSAPSVWYFTSVDGTIKRKSKAKTTREHIAEEFLKRASPSGIAAYYVSSETGIGTTAHDLDNDVDEQDISKASTRTTIEYFNREELQDFLFNRHKARPEGILQRFVEPNGDHNNMIRVLWSPKVCLLERRVNRLKISDTRYDKYERAVTFEGPDFHSQVKPVRGPQLVMQVHEIADSIVQHVAAVTGDRMKISRMALNFKFDDRERLWLLFPSSIRIRDELRRARQQGKGLSNTPLEANAVLQVPDHVRRIGTTVPSRPASLQCTCRCPICQEKVDPNGLWDVSYKVLIEYDERRHGVQKELPIPMWPPPTSEDVNTREEVPETLQQLHPRLTEEEYARHRHDVTFLYKVASVCEACYLRFSAPQLGTQWRTTLDALGGDDDHDDVPETDTSEAVALKGTQALDPERLRKRHRATVRKIERQVDEHEQVEELLHQHKRPKEYRSKSCPKLPSWGPGLAGPVQWPPAPVLSSEPRPKPPGGPAPTWSGARAVSIGPHDDFKPSPQRRRRVPPLRGESYLKELQEFAARCPDRAEAVLPSKPPRVCRAAKKQTRTVGAAKSAPAGTEAVATAQAPSNHVETSEGEMEHSDAGADTKLDLGDFEEDDVPLDASDVMDGVTTDPLVAQLWSKWPRSFGFTGGRGESRTPTTRPPSQGEAMTSLPSSYPSSRPSTRPASRLWSAQSGARPSQPQMSSSTRPWSSPQVAARRSPTPGPGLASPVENISRAQTSMQITRPASSPQLASCRYDEQTKRDSQQGRTAEAASKGEVRSPPRKSFAERARSASSHSVIPAGPRATGPREAVPRAASAPKAASRAQSPASPPRAWK